MRCCSCTSQCQSTHSQSSQLLAIRPTMHACVYVCVYMRICMYMYVCTHLYVYVRSCMIDLLLPSKVNYGPSASPKFILRNRKKRRKKKKKKRKRISPNRAGGRPYCAISCCTSALMMMMRIMMFANWISWISYYCTYHIQVHAARTYGKVTIFFLSRSRAHV